MDNSAPAPGDYAQVENKLLLLYLIYKMDIPISSGQISQFALGESVMSYFELAESLSEMVDDKYVDGTTEYNNTRYIITEKGQQILEYFEKRIPLNLRNRISKYVLENRKDIKRDYETTANYFKDIATGDYTVKCGIYEDENMLMEINLTVVTREQARFICRNWKNNVTALYGDVLNKLTGNGGLGFTEYQEGEACETYTDCGGAAYGENESAPDNL